MRKRPMCTLLTHPLYYTLLTHTIYYTQVMQISDEEKANVSAEAQAAARQMGQVCVCARARVCVYV